MRWRAGISAARDSTFSPRSRRIRRTALFRQEKVLLSPHNAALTEECAIRMATQAVQNVLDCLDGKLQPRVVMNRREIGMA